MRYRLHWRSILLAALSLSAAIFAAVSPAQTAETEARGETGHVVVVGDTWTALAWRYGTSPQSLLQAARAINSHRQPAVGSLIQVPAKGQRNGRLLRLNSGGLLELAARQGHNPWLLTAQNKLRHPFQPTLYGPIYVKGGTTPPREFPAGITGLALAPRVLYPGAAFALRGFGPAPAVALERQPLLVTRDGAGFIALGATGAFHEPGQHLLTMQVAEGPLWEQPLSLSERDWTWEQLTFPASAATDPETMRQERERLQALWDQVTPRAAWQGAFELPIEEYVELSSRYGARRSINGGPYETYHEGADFSAYRGSAVTAPAAGVVVLAENLAVRGGAVVLDHGRGLHSGYYHLSRMHVIAGQRVDKGALLGEVGSSGRSTGNHLHWDLLVGRTWVDPLLWVEQDLASWLSPAAAPDAARYLR